MADKRSHLTDKVVAQLPAPKTGQYRVRDTELPGFLVVVGRRRRTFAVKGERWSHGRRISCQITLGHFGEMTTREARASAKLALGQIAKGDVGPKRGAHAARPAEALTLRAAWSRYLTSHMIRKGRSEATISGYRDHVERLMKDWLDMPLADLAKDPGIVADMHDQLTRRNGPSAANGTMRTLRAIYNHARKTNRGLPPDNPTYGVDWNREIRRDTAMGVQDLPRWFEEAGRLRHPIRREFHLFMLLSGSRPAALMRARLEDLDLRRRVLHIPRPKGGAAKAFDIPLSRPMIRCLMRAIRMNRILHPEEAKTWIFAADSADGCLIEHKEPRSKLFKWGNDLRQTYRTLAQPAGVNRIDIHLLMNHSVPGVNEGYITREKLVENHLRAAQERLSQLIIRQGTAIRPGQAKERLWPNISGRRIGDYRVDPTPLDPRAATTFTKASALVATQAHTPRGSDDELDSPWTMLG